MIWGLQQKASQFFCVRAAARTLAGLILCVGGCDHAAQQESDLSERSPRDSEPALAEFESAWVDLGEVPTQPDTELREVRVWIRNRGGEPLRCHRLEMSCGCLLARVEPMDIAPGSVGELIIGANVSVPGEHTVAVTVHSNSSANTPQRVQVHWKSLTPYVAVPEELDLGRLLPGEVNDAECVLQRSKAGGWSKGSTISLDQPDNSEGFGAELTDLTLKVRVAAAGESGIHHRKLRLRLSECNVEWIEIPVRWEVVPVVELQPRSVFAGTLAGGTTWSRQVVLRVHDESALAAVATAPIPRNMEGMQLTWQQLTKFSWLGKLEGVAPDLAGPFERELLIEFPRVSDLNARLLVTGYVVE